MAYFFNINLSAWNCSRKIASVSLKLKSSLLKFCLQGILNNGDVKTLIVQLLMASIVSSLYLFLIITIFDTVFQIVSNFLDLKDENAAIAQETEEAKPEVPVQVSWIIWASF